MTETETRTLSLAEFRADEDWREIFESIEAFYNAETRATCGYSDPFEQVAEVIATVAVDNDNDHASTFLGVFRMYDSKFLFVAYELGDTSNGADAATAEWHTSLSQLVALIDPGDRSYLAVALIHALGTRLDDPYEPAASLAALGLGRSADTIITDLILQCRS